MADIIVVTNRSSLYRRQCTEADKIYIETLGVKPTSYPPTFLCLQDKGVIVGGVGIWRGTEKQKFLTEIFCIGQDVDLGALYQNRNILSRAHIAEACCLYLQREYRRMAIDMLFSAVYEFLAGEGISTLLLTQSILLRSTFRRLGTDVTLLCTPDLTHYDCDEDTRTKWQQCYFDKLRPTCCYIDVAQARTACQEALVDADMCHSRFGHGITPSRQLELSQ